MAERSVMIALGTKLGSTSGVDQLKKSIGGVSAMAAGVFVGQALLDGAKKAAELIGEAFGKVRDFMKESIAESMAYQDAVNDLGAAFRTAGFEADGLVTWGKRLADTMQQQTRFSDDAVLKMQGLLVTYGLMPSKLDQATKATLDFAVATRRDLSTAAEAVGKALAGQTVGLQKLGVRVDVQGLDAAETQAKVLQALQERFGGRAAADVQSYAGQLAQLGNLWDDIKQKVGDFVVQSGGSVSIMGQLKGIVGDISKALDEYGPLIRVAVNDGLKLAGELLGDLWRKTRQWVEQGGLVETWYRLKSVVIALAGIFQKLWGEMQTGLSMVMNQVAVLLEAGALVAVTNRGAAKQLAKDFRAATTEMAKSAKENLAEGWKKLTVDAPGELMHMDEKIAANRKRIEAEAARMRGERAAEDERIARAKEQALEVERRKLAELTAEDRKRLAEEQKRLKTMAEQYGMMSALERAQVRAVLGKLQAGGQSAFESLGGKEMETIRKSDVLKEFVKRQGFAQGLTGRELGTDLAKSVFGKVDVQAVLRNEITAKLEIDGPSIAQQITEKVMPQIHELLNSAVGVLSGAVRQSQSAGAAVSGAASG